MAKARRGRKQVRPAKESDSGGGAREHWRADGEPKTPYRSADEANRSAFQARLEHGVDLDSYACSICGSWHLGNRRD